MIACVFFGALLLGGVDASANGALYACDSTKLTSENLCYFVATSSNSVGASPHNINRAVAADGYRKVVDATGKALSVSPKPWTQGDTLAASSSELTGDLFAYSKAFEMVAPLRDAMMYAPGTLRDDAAKWASMTKMFTDCQVKNVDEAGDHGTAYSVDSIYGRLVDPSNTGMSHHNVLQFLEEGTIDLVCLMTGLSMSRCDTIRAKAGVASTSTCWEEAYATMYPSSALPPSVAPTAAPTAAPMAAPTPAPTAASTGAPTAAPTVTPTDSLRVSSANAFNTFGALLCVVTVGTA